MNGRKIEAIPFAARVLRAACVAGLLAVAAAALPNAAHADCDVPDNGVPEETLLSSLGPNWASLGGVRPALAKSGIAIGATDIEEVLGNPSGGLKQGTHYDGLLDVSMDIDFERMAGWKGLCFHVNGFQIRGTSISAQDLGSIVSASNIEAWPSTRLDEFWFEQHMLNDKVSVRFGALAVDTEFLIADSAGAFIANTFGWTTISSDNLPFGGPIYPFASPGVRLRIEPNNHFKLMIDVNDDNPVGPCPESLDPGQCTKNGLEFRLDDPPLLLVEADYAYDHGVAGLPGTVKLGGWQDFGKFNDQRLDVNRALLGVTGAPPLRHDGTYAFYGVIDQLIYRFPGEGDARGVSIFARVVGSPSDRNQINAYADAGIVFTGMMARRPSDLASPTPAYPTMHRHLTGIRDSPSREATRPSWRLAIRPSLRPAGRCSRTSNTSGSPAAMCLMSPGTGPCRMQPWWGHARRSAFKKDA